MNHGDFVKMILQERPDVKKEYDTLGPEYQKIREEIEAQNAQRSEPSKGTAENAEDVDV